ncbi:hypothetical protein N7466_003222 [Penicillium verhagenii]|uniref:uncharacterized protein n=1 Tax=Penicillium verhagenii TaxID=1562060 RepID=UPI0025452279|nr:uncharacterized protein N7466_003222 [Penicillium verhagenii]KAJ5936772.1 hypothetical protein N7466_003222 [Penicillium verhagenii]
MCSGSLSLQWLYKHLRFERPLLDTKKLQSQLSSSTALDKKPTTMERLDKYKPSNKDDQTVSILRSFYTHLPNDGRTNFILDLEPLQTDEELHDYAESLVNGFLIPMRSETIRTPFVTAQQAALKAKCLDRDGSRCVLSKTRDKKDYPHDKPNTNKDTFGDLECVSVIPFSLAECNDETESEGLAKELTWTRLERFFPALIARAKFTRKSIYETRNALTLERGLYVQFGSFACTLEPTDDRHSYCLLWRKFEAGGDRASWGSSLRLLMMRCHRGRHKLPTPELLEIHSAVAHIFHEPGVRPYVERALDDLRKTEGLAESGSTNISSLLAITSLGAFSSRAGGIEKVRAKLEPLEEEEENLG